MGVSTSKWKPSESDRQHIVARLEGYLDALASVNGTFRDYTIGTFLFPFDGRGVEQCLREELEKLRPRPVVLISARHGESFDAFLRSRLLTEPFGRPVEGRDIAVMSTISEVVFQACQMASSLADDFRPTGVWHLEATTDRVSCVAGCAIQYEQDVLVVLHEVWKRAG